MNSNKVPSISALRQRNQKHRFLWKLLTANVSTQQVTVQHQRTGEIRTLSLTEYEHWQEEDRIL